MGGIEFSKQLDVCIFSLKAEPMGIIREEVRRMGTAEFVLMGFNALCDHNGAGRGDQPGLFVRKKPF